MPFWRARAICLSMQVLPTAWLRFKAAQISTARGRIAVTGTASIPRSSDLKANLSLPDLSALGAGFHGGVDGSVAFAGRVNSGSLTLQAKGADLAIGQPQADALLRGASNVAAKIALTADGLRIDHADLSNPQLTASVTGAASGTSRDLKLAARLTNLGLLYPQFPGEVTVSAHGRSGK